MTQNTTSHKNTIPSDIEIAVNEGYRLGAYITNDGYAFAFVSASEEISLLLYSNPDDEPEYEIRVGKEYKDGEVFSFIIKGINLDGYMYIYRDGEENITDPYAKSLKIITMPDGTKKYYGVLTGDRFSWNGDKSLHICPSDLVIYKLHVKGYTKNRFSKVKNKGTFKGLAEKIPYFLELGINGVELMPAYEFVSSGAGNNFWGYDKGYYFAPKADYCACYLSGNDYTTEVKEMIKKFHANGIEVYMEFYFPREITAGLIDDCLRYWKKEYHIDGAHVLCDERVRLILAEDVYLKDFKIFYSDWYHDCNNKNLIEYNDGFRNVSRRILKGDEDQLQAFFYAMCKNPNHASTVNYVASNNGFTLADLFSYDRKHNEDNGENNRDGEEYNLSWNCGVEGPTKKRKIQELRSRLMKNAMTILFTAQGIPLIFGGDEFGNSQHGNNNPYCQDNETGWVDWGAFTRNRKFFEFVKELIAFRREHTVLHMDKEPSLVDYRYHGLPDVSYHGSKAWYPDMAHYNRHGGILYCGKYAAKPENDVYLAFNMHWEPHEIALPSVPESEWEIMFTTGTEMNSDKPEKFIVVEPRTVVVLTNKKNS